MKAIAKHNKLDKLKNEVEPYQEEYSRKNIYLT